MDALHCIRTRVRALVATTPVAASQLLEHPRRDLLEANDIAIDALELAEDQRQTENQSLRPEVNVPRAQSERWHFVKSPASEWIGNQLLAVLRTNGMWIQKFKFSK